MRISLLEAVKMVFLDVIPSSCCFSRRMIIGQGNLLTSTERIVSSIML